MTKPINPVKMITEAITDEKQGTAFYKKLASTLPEKKEKKMVLAIAKQEANHRKKMIKLKKDMVDKD